MTHPPEGMKNRGFLPKINRDIYQVVEQKCLPYFSSRDIFELFEQNHAPFFRAEINTALICETIFLRKKVVYLVVENGQCVLEVAGCGESVVFSCTLGV